MNRSNSRTALLLSLLMAATGCGKPHKTADPQSPAPQPAKADTGTRTPEADAPYSIRWKSYSASATYDLDNRGAQQSINLVGELKVPDKADVMAISPARITEATDEQGRSLLPNQTQPLPPAIARAFDARSSPPDPRFENFAYFNNQMPTQVNLALQVHFFPRAIRRLTGEVSIMLATGKETKDIKFDQATSDFEVAPGLSVRLADESLQQLARLSDTPRSNSPVPQQVPVTLRVRKATRTRNYDYRAMTQPPSVISFSLLDQDGHVIEDREMNRNFGGSDGGGRMDFMIMRYITIRPAQRVSAVRLSLLTAVETKTIPFDLKDLPVP